MLELDRRRLGVFGDVRFVVRLYNFFLTILFIVMGKTDCPDDVLLPLDDRSDDVGTCSTSRLSIVLMLISGYESVSYQILLAFVSFVI